MSEINPYMPADKQDQDAELIEIIEPDYDLAWEDYEDDTNN